MRISDLELFAVQIERSGSAPLRTLLIALTTDSGHQGWGEAPLRWNSSELSERRLALLPNLANRSVFDIEELLRLDCVDSPPLAAALETACWDLVGRITKQPLCHLWGGGYRRRISLTVRLDVQTDPAQNARELVEHGFHNQIVSASVNVDDDLRTIHQVLEATGERCELILDAHGSYSAVQARQLCAQVSEESLRYILDPLAGRNLELFAALAREVETPLALSEAIRSPRDVLAAARSGAATAVMIDMHRVGGLSSARSCAAIAEAAGMPVSFLVGPSAGIATAAMLQLTAACPAFSEGSHWDFLHAADDVLTTSLEVVDGMGLVPQGAGLGVEVDRTKVEQYQIA